MDKIDISNCSSCGEDHKDLPVFESQSKTEIEFGNIHYTFCPINLELIYIKGYKKDGKRI